MNRNSRIPADGRGFVEESALYAHLLDSDHWSSTGKHRSVSSDRYKAGPKIHVPEGEAFTAEELEASGWWDAVNGSDLIGVDDGTSYVFRTFTWMDGRLRSVFSRIAIIASAQEQERIIGVMADSFTRGELEDMARGGLVIEVSDSAPMLVSDYDVGSPIARLPRGFSDSMLVRVLLDHLGIVEGQEVDGRCAMEEARIRSGTGRERAKGKRAARLARKAMDEEGRLLEDVRNASPPGCGQPRIRCK